MKLRIVPLLAAAAIGALLCSSCKEEADANDGKTLVIQDSLSTVLPTWQALKVKLENKSHMNVIVGDAKLYTATPEEKAKKAEELGKMILRIYGKNNLLEDGNLVVTKNVRNQSETPEDGISTPIPFAELKKAGN